MILNVINGNGNRFILVDKNTNKDAIKEFLITTLSKCDTQGNFIETPYSESKLTYSYPIENILNIYVLDLHPEAIGEHVLCIQDDRFGKCSHLPYWYIKQQVDKYWDTIDHFIESEEIFIPK